MTVLRVCLETQEADPLAFLHDTGKRVEVGLRDRGLHVLREDALHLVMTPGTRGCPPVGWSAESAKVEVVDATFREICSSCTFASTNSCTTSAMVAP